MPKQIEVVGAVFRKGDAILACRRSMHRPSGGKWEFPGGKVEEGESQEAALVREVKEELGIDIEVGNLIDRTVTHLEELAVDLACYLVTSDDLPTLSSDHDDIRWVSKAELSTLNWALPDLPAVSALMASLDR